MNISLGLNMGIFAILILLGMFVIAFKIDFYTEKKGLWKPIILFMLVPISLAVGLYYIPNTIYSINWWLGVYFFLFSILLSMSGTYYALNFGR